MLASSLLAVLIAPFATSSPLPRWTCSASPCSLASLAESSGKLYFGTAWQSFYTADPRFEPILDAQFNGYTPENEMKWEVIEPERGVFNFTGGDIIIAESKKTTSLVRGHNFVWYQQTPDYVTNITTSHELKAVLKEHIDAVLGRYGPDLYAFDVINEALNDNGTYRDSVWYNVLGKDFIGIALDYAHAAAPNVKLYINDYNIESVSNKSSALVEIAKELLAKGHPLHGIGFESHFIGGGVPSSMAASMKQFTDLGLDVAITELDVRLPVDSQGLANATDLAQQAKDYTTVVDVCLNNGQCPGITVWGFGDEFSWIPSTFPGFGAADLYNLSFVPKPAYYAVQTAL